MTAGIDLTDAGNADRFAASVGGDLRYLGAESTWVIKRGTRWVAVEDEVAIREMVFSIREFHDAASHDLERQFAAHSLQHERIIGAVELAKAHVDLLVGVAELEGEVVGIEVQS